MPSSPHQVAYTSCTIMMHLHLKAAQKSKPFNYYLENLYEMVQESSKWYKRVVNGTRE